METPCRSASATVSCITVGSPAWKPQAMLAELISGITPASSPLRQAPKLSPRSALMFTTGTGCLLDHHTSLASRPCPAQGFHAQWCDGRKARAMRLRQAGDGAMLAEFSLRLDPSAAAR